MKWMVVLLAALLLLPVSTYSINKAGHGMEENFTATTKEGASNEISAGDDTEYWALLVAVGIYANAPDMDRPSMLSEVKNFYNTLLVSSMWNESHIKMITAKNATVINIFKGFRWLAENADENDICLVYITTHGFPIIFDIPPFDEADGMDEALAAYRGFLPFQSPWSWEQLANPFGIITDDEINFMLNRINAKGICFIVDSCHSGATPEIARNIAGKIERIGKEEIESSEIREIVLHELGSINPEWRERWLSYDKGVKRLYRHYRDGLYE